MICERFNDYFVNSIIEINGKIPKNKTQIDLNNSDEPSNLKFRFETTNVDELSAILKFLTKKINKSEKLNSQVWFDSSEYCGHFLADIINESLITGFFPNEWKTTTVIPIPKIKNTKNADEHRGINTLPIDEKVIEVVVKNQLVKFIEDNKLISPQQSAFRSNHSCESTMNYVLNEWKRAQDNNKIVLAVFLDLKRAFETVDRKLMLEKLQSKGICDTELKWFANYLGARKQKTKFNGQTSKEKEIPIGLPQGTALSVILFSIYIDKITEITKNSSVVLFADDTGIYVTADSLDIAISKMNEDLELIYEWLNENKLMLNIKKTNWMVISRNVVEIDNSHEVKIGNEIINRVNSIKFLGVVIDEKLTLKEQTAICTKKAASKTNLLYRISKRLTFSTKKVIYNSIVLPNLQYCSTIYITCNREEIERMQKIQNRAMRLVLNCEYRTHREWMLKTLNWLSIDQMIKFNVLIYIYKMINGLLPKYLSDNLIFTRDAHTRNTRQRTNNELRLPNFKYWV